MSSVVGKGNCLRSVDRWRVDLSSCTVHFIFRNKIVIFFSVFYSEFLISFFFLIFLFYLLVFNSVWHLFRKSIVGNSLGSYEVSFLKCLG